MLSCISPFLQTSHCSRSTITNPDTWWVWEFFKLDTIHSLLKMLSSCQSWGFLATPHYFSKKNIVEIYGGFDYLVVHRRHPGNCKNNGCKQESALTYEIIQNRKRTSPLLNRQNYSKVGVCKISDSHDKEIKVYICIASMHWWWIPHLHKIVLADALFSSSETTSHRL